MAPIELKTKVQLSFESPFTDRHGINPPKQPNMCLEVTFSHSSPPVTLGSQ
jgi:hypothetical protein